MCDTELDKFFNSCSEAEWIEALPNYQQNTLTKLITDNSLEEAANYWLKSGFNYTSPFSSGNTNNNKKYFPLLKKEVHRLLCGDPKYSEERNELRTLIKSGGNKTAVVSSVSAFIGAKIGFSASFVAPVIVIVLIMISETALNAWCQLEND